MDGLTLPCSRCAPTAPVEVVGDLIRCSACGHERAFVRATLYLVTGPPASGKSSVVPHLAGRLPGTALFDTDLFGPSSNPDWMAWASSWLLVVHGLAQSGLRAVLCGYGISRSRAEGLPPRALLGSIRVLNLDLDRGHLRGRLRNRPGYDDARIERKVAAADDLREEADENIDVTNRDELAVAAAIQAWLERQFAADA